MSFSVYQAGHTHTNAKAKTVTSITHCSLKERTPVTQRSPHVTHPGTLAFPHPEAPTNPEAGICPSCTGRPHRRRHVCSHKPYRVLGLFFK